MRSLGLSLNVLEASTEAELDTAFASPVQREVGALLVAQKPSYNRWHEHTIPIVMTTAGDPLGGLAAFQSTATRESRGRSSFSNSSRASP